MSEQVINDMARLQRDLTAMTERNTELAKRVTELERGLEEACEHKDMPDSGHPLIVRLRALARGTAR